MNAISILKMLDREKSLSKQKAETDSILANRGHWTTEEKQKVNDYYWGLINDYKIKAKMEKSLMKDRFFYDPEDDEPTTPIEEPKIDFFGNPSEENHNTKSWKKSGPFWALTEDNVLVDTDEEVKIPIEQEVSSEQVTTYEDQVQTDNKPDLMSMARKVASLIY